MPNPRMNGPALSVSEFVNFRIELFMAVGFIPGGIHDPARIVRSMQADSSTDFLYFAYGSNLLTRRLLARTPSATKLCNGVLRQHELRWHKAGEDGSGKCDVLHSAETSSLVHGVVYRILAAEQPALDAAESLGVGYQLKQVVVEADRGQIKSWLYCAIRIDAEAVPYDWYQSLVIAGAREHGFPDAYVERLEAVRSKPDPDSARAKFHFDIVDLVSRSMNGLPATAKPRLN
jgi:gamma-glutamylcyclotransferase